MAGGIVYLDVDDEITSAATRIRDVPGRRVALVLPYGSRVATSRINFRLLSRDALINEKQLAVVAGDSATRSLAASAGLPVFSSVGEYEAAQGRPEEDWTPAPDATTPSPTASSGSVARAGRGQSKSSAAGGVRGAAGAGAIADAAGAATAGSSPGPGSARDVGPTAVSSRVEQTVRSEHAGEYLPDDHARLQPRRPSGASARHPQTRPGSVRGSRLPLIIVLAALALVVLVGGVGAYVVLPSATIVVTPRAQSLVLPDITVTADPAATSADAAALVVPAAIVSLEVTASDAFAATGKRIEEAAAKGTVRFANLDFLRTNTIPSGSIVSTNAGVRFRTAATITVPRADLVGLTVFPGRKNVRVTAVEPGTPGNVEPNTIVIVPQGEDPQALKVVNQEATTGGTHDEFPKVTQKDVDAAVAKLTTALGVAFQARLTDPSIGAPGATVFTSTAKLGRGTPDVDPDTLVDREVDAFELAMTATGTVVTVDPAPVSKIADELLRASVEPGHELVSDSIHVQVGQPVVTGQSVAFSASARGEQVAMLDADALKALVLGKPLDSARETLSPYGDVQLTAWPEWVGAVPTLADRVTVRIEQKLPIETPAPSGSPA